MYLFEKIRLFINLIFMYKYWVNKFKLFNIKL